MNNVTNAFTRSHVVLPHGHHAPFKAERSPPVPPPSGLSTHGVTWKRFARPRVPLTPPRRPAGDGALGNVRVVFFG